MVQADGCSCCFPRQRQLRPDSNKHLHHFGAEVDIKQIRWTPSLDLLLTAVASISGKVKSSL